MSKRGVAAAVAFVVVALSLMFVVIARRNEVPEHVRVARELNADALISMARMAAQNPAQRQRLKILESDRYVVLSLYEQGPSHVRIHLDEDKIIVNHTGTRDIHDSNGDGTANSCSDCPVEQTRDEYQADFEKGVEIALKRLGITAAVPNSPAKPKPEKTTSRRKVPAPFALLF